MIDKNDFDSIDLTRSTGNIESSDPFSEVDFLKSLERSMKEEREELYKEADYSLDDYMKLDPSVDLGGAGDQEHITAAREKAYQEIMEDEKNPREKTEEEKELEEAMADAPASWNSEITEEDADDMWHSYVMILADEYGIQNAKEIEFDKLENAVMHLDTLYQNGKISKPLRVNGSLIVNDKGEVVVAGVSQPTDWAHTTNAVSDVVKNMNYDATLENDGI